MSTADKTDTQRYAELAKGRIYILGNIEFEHGQVVPITPEQEAHLREHATDNITLENTGEVEFRQKFLFMDSTQAEARRTLKDRQATENNRIVRAMDGLNDPDEPTPTRSRTRQVRASAA